LRLTSGGAQKEFPLRLAPPGEPDLFDIEAEQFFGVLFGDSHSRFDAGGVSPPDGPCARGTKVGFEFERLEALDEVNGRAADATSAAVPPVSRLNTHGCLRLRLQTNAAW
jgi:hypothetical protein